MKLEDERLAPLLEAMNQVDRVSLGFTPIPKDTTIEWEQGRQTYDVMLHIYSNKAQRTVAFLKIPDGYKWIGEQEIHIGPNQYTDENGTAYEQIVITYETERVSGFPLNQINIDYYGDDPRLSHRSNLTLDDVRPILAEWNKLEK